MSPTWWTNLLSLSLQINSSSPANSWIVWICVTQLICRERSCFQTSAKHRNSATSHARGARQTFFLRNWLFDSFCQARLWLIVLKIDHRGLSPLSSITVLRKISGPPKVMNKKDKSTLLSSEPKILLLHFKCGWSLLLFIFFCKQPKLYLNHHLLLFYFSWRCWFRC